MFYAHGILCKGVLGLHKHKSDLACGIFLCLMVVSLYFYTANLVKSEFLNCP